MMNWRQHSIEILAARPTEWVRLCELFADVEQEIPIHIAMRRQCRASEKEVGLNTARWRLFLSHIGPLVDRQSNSGEREFRAKRTDLVRLRPHDDPCECGGSRFLVAWPERGYKRQYACASCRPTLPEPATAAAPAAEPEPIRREQKPRLNAHQRRGNRPVQVIRGPSLAVRRQTRPPKPQAQAPPAPRAGSAGIFTTQAPIMVYANQGLDRVTFQNRRVLASWLKAFLGLRSVNQADAELQRYGLTQLLAKHGRQALDFIRRVRRIQEELSRLKGPG